MSERWSDSRDRISGEPGVRLENGITRDIANTKFCDEVNSTFSGL